MKEKVVVKRVGEEPEVKEINVRDLKETQSIVEGYIQTVRLPNNILMVVNEEGLIKELPLNFEINESPFFGNVYFCSADDEDFIGLDDFQIQYLLEMFKKNPIYLYKE